MQFFGWADFQNAAVDHRDRTTSQYAPLGIDRATEAIATQRAADLGVGPELLARFEAEDVLVCAFLPGVTLTAADVRDRVGEIGAKLRAFHRSAPLPTAFAVGGAYTAKFAGGILTLGFAFQQETVAGTTTRRDLSFTGSIVHKGGTTFIWELAIGSGKTTIAIAADQLQLGPLTAATKVTVTMQNGQVQGVQALLGFSF